VAAHTTEQRAFIVGQLAAYITPEAIVLDFALRFRGTTCTLADVEACDPRRLDSDWRAYFDERREAFLNPPTASRQHRIAELHRMFVQERDRGARDSAAKLLAQIATEAGPEDGASGASRPITAIEYIVTHAEPLPPEQMP
jgi:hypothetical protein